MQISFNENRQILSIRSNERFFVVLRKFLITIVVLTMLIIAATLSLKSFVFYLVEVILLLILIVLFGSGVLIEIDKQRLRFRQGFRVFALNFGKWKNISSIDYISVFNQLGRSDSIGSAALPVTTISKIKLKELKVNLIYNKNRRLQLFENLNLDQARKVALDIGQYLGIGVYDSTEKESSWLKRN